MSDPIAHVAGTSALARAARLPRPTTVDGLIDSSLMARLDSLDVLSRKIFAGKVRGERRSRRRGQSVEFADFRPYVPGDDLRFVDWNIYGRLDRLFLKLFLEEEDLTLALAIDTSASMGFGQPEKFTFARRLAMALGYVGLVNHNRVGLYAFGGDGVRPLTGLRGRRRVREMGSWLLGLECAGPTQFEQAMRTVALSRHGRGVLVIISDLMQEGAERSLRSIAGRGFDVYAMQVLSPEEIDPGAHGVSGDLRLVDSESGAATEVTAGTAVLAAYRKRLSASCREIHEASVRFGISHSVVDTSCDFNALLLDYLRRRGLLK